MTMNPALDERPIMSHQVVYHLEPADDGTGRVAVYKPRGNPEGRILYYEGVTIHDNGGGGRWWRGHHPFCSGGELCAETRLDPELAHLNQWDRARSTVARTWGHVLGEHHITNRGDLDVPLFHPEHWEQGEPS